MNNQESLRKLFQEGYNRDNWLLRLRQFFPEIKFFAKPQPISGSEAEVFVHLGNASIENGLGLGIYEIKVGANTRLARNRVQLRQMVAKQVLEKAQDGALAVYYDVDQQWRFSYIAIEHRLPASGELKREQTAVKRYTYLLGKGTKIRTAVDRFDALPQNPSLEQLRVAFAVETLNKEFYRKLDRWYQHAKGEVKFPNGRNLDKQTHAATSLIRLLTRLLFVWFLKEKHLINKDLFDQTALEGFIHWQQPSSYYKAIIQNLFFATLNREIKDRSLRAAGSGSYLVPNVYRYQGLFRDLDPETIIARFAQTPFLNGGLFECLDREATAAEQQQYDRDNTIRSERRAMRMDGFSDREDNPINVPNELFFNADERQPGLIELFSQYQFTVEESAPLDIEVALDPELMGLIFENLLADYNPETRENARKNSGSFYTPRQIVAYMVDESVKAYLRQALLANTDADDAEQKLKELFSGTKPSDPQQTTLLIAAIDSLRILDPAVGSGAFPMGVLQRLIALLECLDPENRQFRQRQIDKAEAMDDDASQKQSIADIEDIFSGKKAYNNYGRKLYLIENCLFGVDIQPIAIQIAKLRFFISLAIEQIPTADAEKNYGIRALPNLETKFVVANSLIQLERSVENQQFRLRNPEIEEKERELHKVRRSYFNAKTPATKRKYQCQDKTLRVAIAALLINDGWDDGNAQKIATWDIYNQNAMADWFDPEWMFGITKGFDLVIGNPPYIRQERIMEFKPQFETDYQVFTGTADIYTYFYEKGVNLLSENGHLCYISSNKWMRAKYGQKLRCFFKTNTQLKQIIDFGGQKIFENSTVDTNILLCTNTPRSHDSPLKEGNDSPALVKVSQEQPDRVVYYAKQLPNVNNPLLAMPVADLSTNAYTLQPPEVLAIKNKIEKIGTPLKHWDINIYRGVLTGFNRAFIIDTDTKEQLIAADPRSAELIKSMLRGRDIKAYQHHWAGLWIIFIPWHFPLHKDKHITGSSKKAEQAFIDRYPVIYNHLLKYKEKLSERNKAETGIRYEWYAMQRCANTYYKEFAKEKIIYNDITKRLSFSLSKADEYFNNTVYFISSNKDLLFQLAVLNSSLINWYYKIISVQLGTGVVRMFNIYVEQLPIPKISTTEQQPFINLVDKILTAKAETPDADTSGLESQIDRLVYLLYDLSREEIAVIENPNR